MSEVKKYALLNKATNRVDYSYTAYRQKSLPLPWSDSSQYAHFKLTPNTDIEAYSWDGTQVVFDDTYVKPDPKLKWPKLHRASQ